MAKHKKKHSKKKGKDKSKDAVADDVLDAAALSIRKFRKVTNEISKLSLGQKLAGSVVLLAAGLIYLDQRKGSGSEKPQHPPKFEWPRLAEAQETSATEEATTEEAAASSVSPAPPRKSHKSSKAGKSHGSGSRKPLAADEVA
ncbi:hypothetical protein MUN84_09795 [Hymenobacter sp. 5516J-16]|uniref:hypothetical protein n=1 Tax=Hymenobacter sp. 5516J-16 TaxID=2932253 RepID=UPI001FD5CE7F|nr:hypothetical protein [Hymenobacter sp. 5516J-16]UOQ78794.1 hypothetical protein MUN84_09795 [Hymenobacter sp. 5516J-16]